MKTIVEKSFRGFTLIELLIVIGIIGILASVMMGVFGGASESAMAAKCMTNLRNLAVATHNYAVTDEGYMPAAGAYEYLDSKGMIQRRGWITWDYGLSDPYEVKNSRTGMRSTSHVASPSWTVYATYPEGNKSETERHLRALKRGSVWEGAGRSTESYVCPVHQKACHGEKYVAAWSYVMNAFFGYDTTQGNSSRSWYAQNLSGFRSRQSGMPVGAERVLLFAELPFATIPSNIGSIQNSVELFGTDSRFDCTLHYREKEWKGTVESIGFNHRVGKRYMAHVAFADGHVSKLMLPKADAATPGDIQNLTTWLCQGDDISFDGSRYERVNQTDIKTY